jgi:hypothetical protein
MSYSACLNLLRSFLTISLFTFLTAVSGLSAAYADVQCSNLVGSELLRSQDLRWPADLAVKSNLSVDENMFNLMLEGLNGDRDNSKMARSAIRFLILQADLPSAQTAKLWEKAVRIIQRRDPRWLAARIPSVDGSYVYVGVYGLTLAIAPNGKIYRGEVNDGDVTNGIWQAHYGRMTLLSR